MYKLKISVIIPVKNRANLLPLTLNSVLQQSLSPYEVIVVDDASTDDISAVVERYKNNVIFTKSKGAGPGGGRNTGLEIATGNLIQFFDSDDLMTRNKLEVQASRIQQKEVDFAYGPFVKARFENNGWIQEDVLMQYFALPNGLLADYVLQGWCNIFQSALFKRELVNEAGAWREDIFTHEDYEYWFRIAQLTNRYAHERESCVFYRQHQQQITDLHLVEKARWRNELTALDAMKKETRHKPSTHTQLMFAGREYKVKAGYKHTFGDNNMAVNKRHRFLAPYYKLFQKWGRLQTGTQWQKMHGTLANGQKEFLNYLNNL